ncbi:MAG: ankyrin repeat domain-containing protein [Prosthecobacter sp.]
MKNPSFFSIVLFALVVSVAAQPENKRTVSQLFGGDLAKIILESDKATFASSVGTLIQAGAKAEEFNDLLGPAAIHEDSFFIHFLLAMGCDINATNRHGENMAVFILERSKPELLESRLKNLVSLGLNIGLADKDGYQLIHKAAMQNKAAIVLNLTHAHGQSIDARTKSGQTCLMLAARFGCVDTLEVALALGADVTIKDSQGHTALDWANRLVDPNDLNEYGVKQEQRARAADLLRKTTLNEQKKPDNGVRETGSGDMKHGKSRVPASFPGEKGNGVGVQKVDKPNRAPPN